MKPFIGIIGYANSGKSSIIASLTGCLPSTYHGYVYDKKNDQSIWVYSSSPQENPVDKSQFEYRLKAVSQPRLGR